jgi:hypothetical protein
MVGGGQRRSAEDAMTDELFGDEGEFDEGFFASLEAAPDDPVEDSGRLLAEDDAFLYETEGDGSFETDAADPDDTAYEDDFHDDAFDDGAFQDTAFHESTSYDGGDEAFPFGSDDGS